MVAAGAAAAGGATLHRYDLDRTARFHRAGRRRPPTNSRRTAARCSTPARRELVHHLDRRRAAARAGPDRRRRLRRRPAVSAATAAAPAPAATAATARLNLDAIEVQVDPRAEWKQIFDEAWRINRDFFYDPNMHGADWPAVKKPSTSRSSRTLTSSADLYRIIRWMLSRTRRRPQPLHEPGERVHESKTVPGGLLGADYEVADGRYRFKKIYGGLNWSSATPLAAHRPGRERQGRRVPPRGQRQGTQGRRRRCTRCSRTPPAS